MSALSTAASGMLAQQRNVEVIANNIANLNTVGYKRQRAEFQDLLYQTLERPGAISSSNSTPTPNGVQIGTGVKTGSVYRIVEQGTVTSTGNDLDLAISGRGLFRVIRESALDAYTRAGNFAISADGRIITEDGHEVAPGVAIPEDAIDISISENGIVEARIAGEQGLRELGQLELVTFFNESGLEAIGDNLLLETTASGQPVIGNPGETGFGNILQGFIEASNVDPVQEITALIAAQRAYEMNARVIETSDEMLSVNANLRG